jgi:prevent-host-death family protein
MIKVRGRQMGTIEVTMTQLRQGLGELVNRAAFGGERVILVSHGAPRAAIISIEDLIHLEQGVQQGSRSAQQGRYTEALTGAHVVRERIQQWQTENHVAPQSVTDILRELREERDDEILGLR